MGDEKKSVCSKQKKKMEARKRITNTTGYIFAHRVRENAIPITQKDPLSVLYFLFCIERTILKAGGIVAVSFGYKIGAPKGTYITFLPHLGLSLQKIRILNPYCDSTYRGEVREKLLLKKFFYFQSLFFKVIKYIKKDIKH